MNDNDNDTSNNGNSNWTENLPKPPVPSLEQTIGRYLSGLEPVIPAPQFEQTKRTAENFLNEGEGERLQKLLTEYAAHSDNWITDFWLDDMYMCNPIPLLVNSNPFFLLPRQTFRCTSEMIHYAASIAHCALVFRQQIERQTLTQEVGKGQKKDQRLCMETYRHFFTACRIPSDEKDRLRFDGGRNNSEHFVVAAFNQFHMVQLEHGKIASSDDIARCLNSIWNEAKASKTSTYGVGILTTENRRTWSTVRQQLLKDETNQNSLEMLETCLFVLCLDDFVTPRVPTKSGYRNSIQIAKMDNSYMASMLLHGGGSSLHTPNRWFDKFLQIIVSKEGICGLVVEHSASEGVTVLRFMEYFLHQHEQRCAQLTRQNTVEMLSTPSSLRCRPLQWNIDPNMEQRIKQAEKHADKLIQDVDFYVLKFMEFGQDFIKKQMISPDVFIQLSLQLTYYKLHRRLVSTYESCSLRQFKKGRVDNIRSATMEALAWSRSMCGDTGISDERKIELFREAICKQTEVLKYTSAGYGPDNHLVALRELSRIHELNMPLLMREKSFKEFINFRLSTSQLFTLEDILIGYGPVVPDGYGCCYMPKCDLIYFCISSFFSAPETSSDFFASSLEGSLLQMRELCLKMEPKIIKPNQ